MQVYVPGTLGDAPLLQWYAQLAANEDIKKIFGPSLWPIAAFMRHFTEPGVMLLYSTDEQGWWCVSWAIPMMGGAAWGVWVRDHKRGSGSRKAIEHIMTSLDVALEHYPVLCNVTKRPEVVDKTVRLGYAYVGVVPMLFEGEDCHVLYLTRALFDPKFKKWQEYHNGRSSQ